MSGLLWGMVICGGLVPGLLEFFAVFVFFVENGVVIVMLAVLCVSVFICLFRVLCACVRLVSFVCLFYCNGFVVSVLFLW